MQKSKCVAGVSKDLAFVQIVAIGGVDDGGKEADDGRGVVSIQPE